MRFYAPFSFFATHKVRWYALQCVLMRLALCFGAPMDRDRFERTHTHRLRRQDVCCGPTGFARYPPPPPLIRLRLNVSCSARRTAAAASKGKSATVITGETMAGGTKKGPRSPTWQANRGFRYLSTPLSFVRQTNPVGLWKLPTNPWFNPFR